MTTSMEHAGGIGSNRRVVATAGPGLFVTQLLLEDAEGRRFVWGSRRNRKGLDPAPHHRRGPRPRHAVTLAPRSPTWWIAVLFMLGSASFVLGSAAGLAGCALAAQAGRVFFVGSVFFTTAAYLQFYEVINEPHAMSGARPGQALWRWQPDKLGWWETVVQLVGTLLFNVNTFEGMRTLAPELEDALVWAPDAIGSVCFLVASYLAFAEVCHGWLGVELRNISWWVVFVNLLGSVAFGVSAVASYVVVDSGMVLSATQANLWTLVGAVCFLAGAYLLLPEMTAHHALPSPTGPPAGVNAHAGG